MVVLPMVAPLVEYNGITETSHRKAPRWPGGFAPATVQPTPTTIVAVQATVRAAATPAQPQQRASGRPTPASMPVTGARGRAKLPTTLQFGAVAFVLVVGSRRFLQRLRSK